MNALRVLVVDDEETLRSLLVAALRFEGFEPVAVGSGAEALLHVETQRPDIVVLDVGLPDLDGFEVCARMRAKRDATPIIFLTARTDPESTIAGFRSGGDDFLTKPFSLEELSLRIRAVARRLRPDANDPVARRVGPFVVNPTAHLVSVSQRPISMTATEFSLLTYLVENEGRVLSKSQILDQVWDYCYEGTPEIVETYISYLRRKIGSPESAWIETIRSVGYVFREPRA